MFLIKVVPQIKGGSPLEYAVVKCNVTQYFEQKDISSKYFSNIAQNQMTLEMANQLAPSVSIDNTRSTQVTDDNGEATFQMKIVKGTNNLRVAVICEC